MSVPGDVALPPRDLEIVYPGHRWAGIYNPGREWGCPGREGSGSFERRFVGSKPRVVTWRFVEKRGD